MNVPSRPTRATSSIDDGVGRVLESDDARTVYSTDNSIYQVFPTQVFVPESVEALVAHVRTNAALPDPQPLTARGGGTGTNGQSLTSAGMIDLKRGLDEILEIDADAGIARVGPGVVTQRLNDQLAPLGLQWAPHTSTVSRATVGGMIATDAAGKGSLIHGRAHRHVLALDVCLADGTLFRAEPITIVEAESRASQADRTGAIWRALLDLDIADGSTFDLPELARGFSGYGIDRLRYDNMIDPLALFVGSEGTLGITTEATLRLVPRASHVAMIIAAYPSFRAALEDAVELRETGPAAIETFDERTLAAGRQSPAWPALGSVVGDLDGAVLILEYESDSAIDPDPFAAHIRDNGRAISVGALVEPAARGSAWKVRADAVGLLGKVEVGAPELSARPTAMVEDCAVPVAAMVDFIDDFRAVLDRFGLEYGMFGHADVGCVHVRPALDLTDPDHERLVAEVTNAVVAAVGRHGGILWGEHGRGLRGDVAPEFLSAETITVMRRVKTIFDPHDLLNPGKLYRPLENAAPLIGLSEAPMRGQRNRTVPVEIRREYAGAFACNGNGLCQQYRPDDVMCPSYKATGNPALSPKGRADLLREVLHRDETGRSDPAFDRAVAENLHQCLSCAACTGTCPIEVDIPELKSRFLERHHRTVRRPISHALLSRFEQLASLAARTPRLASLGAGPAGSVLGLVDLPTPKRRTRELAAPLFRPGTEENYDIVIVREVFTSFLEPDTLALAVDVLGTLGLDVAVSPFVPSGKFDHVKGKRHAFARAVAAQRTLTESISSTGAVPVVLEPAIALLHGHEYQIADPDYPATVRYLADVLADHAEHIAERLERRTGTVTLLGHCTERATSPSSLESWGRVLETAGYDVTTPALGCCGMAGIFGHEAANQPISDRLWELGWADAVERSGHVVATGYSCRSQAARKAGTTPLHPLVLLDPKTSR